MQLRTLFSTAWNDADAYRSYRTGVSLHSHTSVSEESLDIIHTMFHSMPPLRPLFAHYERAALARGVKLDFTRANWRPPLRPRMAFDLEAKQIHSLGLKAMVSITDHDSIEAPMLLRTVASARRIPVSTEWTVPFGCTEFHLGIHNMPTADGPAWMARFDAYSKQPSEAALVTLLSDLHAEPALLTVLNHPIWDLYKVGAANHLRELRRLLAVAGRYIHAVEINGLRAACENREAARLARETGHLLISGGDRHSLEPNAVLNLTQARYFRDFVDEIRIERRSHVLVMPQYSRPWHGRILRSTLDAVTDFPEFPVAWQRWDERAFHPDASGQMRSLAELWPEGKAPLPLRAAIAFVRLGRSDTFTRTFSLALRSSNQMKEADTI
jgi:hypothetical protein